MSSAIAPYQMSSARFLESPSPLNFLCLHNGNCGRENYKLKIKNESQYVLFSDQLN